MLNLKNILLFSVCLTLWTGCKTTSTAPVVSPVNQNIIGSWEGCDGRVITFTEEENAEITGRYTKLGGLGKYKFTLNEIGYRLTQQSPGNYTGTVKWQDLSGNETWKKVSITIENDVYTDNSSDSCSQEMKRV